MSRCSTVKLVRTLQTLLGYSSDFVVIDCPRPSVCTVSARRATAPQYTFASWWHADSMWRHRHRCSSSSSNVSTRRIRTFISPRCFLCSYSSVVARRLLRHEDTPRPRQAAYSVAACFKVRQKPRFYARFARFPDRVRSNEHSGASQPCSRRPDIRPGRTKT